MDGTEETDCRGGAEGHFMQVLLAEQDSSGCFQPAYDFGVRGGNAILKDGAGQRRPDTCRVDVVLESDWDAVKRPAPLATSHLSFRFTRLRQSLLGGHGDEGVKDGVQPFDLLQTGTRQLDRRDCFSAHQSAGFADAQRGEISTWSLAEDVCWMATSSLVRWLFRSRIPP
jgi:hypothetical protein